jgi:hypothetical protein
MAVMGRMNKHRNIRKVLFNMNLFPKSEKRINIIHINKMTFYGNINNPLDPSTGSG